MNNDRTSLVDVTNLKKYFTVKNNAILKAVDDVSFSIARGETLGLVGESGCGKTTCGRTILGLYKATSGSIMFQGSDVRTMDKKSLTGFKKRAQIILQDPYASLDPRMTVGNIVSEGIEVHIKCSRNEIRERVGDMLHKVGLNSEHASRFAHELSGGQRQRIGIARALAVEPEFIVCDEPISALDVSIQAQIVNLLVKLQKDLGLTYLFISHDLSMVKHISDRVGVMYLGSLVELAANTELYEKPLHPYTQALISAIPVPNPSIQETRGRIKLEGEVPSPINPPQGCKFVKRCRHRKPVCSDVRPEWNEVEKDHFVACHLY